MKTRSTFLILVLMIFSMWVGVFIGQQRLKLEFQNWKPALIVNKNPLTSQVSEEDFAIFWKAWERVSDLYVDKTQLDAKKMVDGAVSGMVAAIGDPYTVYLPVRQNTESKEDLGGEFEGVGIQLGFKEKRLAAIMALDGSPAKKADVRAGDLILRIKDEKNNVDRLTDGMSITEAVKLIRGKKGTEVILTMYREGVEKPFDVRLIRATVTVKSVTLKYVLVNKDDANGKKVAWIELSRFGDKTQEEWMAAVNDVARTCGKKSFECPGMVLDVRNNPGGYLDMAVQISGEFLKAGKLVVTQRYGDASEEKLSVNKNGKLLDMPVVVLINEGSASASEIVAGALSDHSRAKLVGQKSFGKGSVQKPEDFEDGSGIHVTVAKWLRPSGEWIDKQGITPDVVVAQDESKKDSASEYDDKQLMTAIGLLAQ